MGKMSCSCVSLVIAVCLVLYSSNTAFVRCDGVTGDVSVASLESSAAAGEETTIAATHVTTPVTSVGLQLSTLLAFSTVVLLPSSLVPSSQPPVESTTPELTSTSLTSSSTAIAAAVTSQSSQGPTSKSPIELTTHELTSTSLTSLGATSAAAAITSQSSQSQGQFTTEVSTSSSQQPSVAAHSSSLPTTVSLSSTTASFVPVTSLQASSTSALLSTTVISQEHTSTVSSQQTAILSSTLGSLQSTILASSSLPTSDVSQTSDVGTTTVTMATSSVTLEHTGPASQVLAIVLGVVLGTALVVAVLSVGLCCCVRSRNKKRADRGKLTSDAEMGQNGSIGNEKVKVSQELGTEVNKQEKDNGAASGAKSAEFNHDSETGESNDGKQRTLKSRVIGLKNAIRKSLVGKRPTSQDTGQSLSRSGDTAKPSHRDDVIVASTENLSLAVPRGTDILVNYKKAQPPKRKPAGRDALRRQATVAPDDEDINNVKHVTAGDGDNVEANDVTITAL